MLLVCLANSQAAQDLPKAPVFLVTSKQKLETEVKTQHLSRIETWKMDIFKNICERFVNQKTPTLCSDTEDDQQIYHSHRPRLKVVKPVSKLIYRFNAMLTRSTLDWGRVKIINFIPKWKWKGPGTVRKTTFGRLTAELWHSGQGSVVLPYGERQTQGTDQHVHGQFDKRDKHNLLGDG